MARLPRIVRNVLMLALVIGIALPAAAATPRRAQEAIDRAQLAMAGKRYVEAAEGMEEAYRFDPDPLWLANAGYARMMASELDRAIEHLSTALADKRLDTDARAKATERLDHAKTARTAVAAARDATQAGDHGRAARAWDEAASHVPIGTYHLAAGASYEQAGELELASARYRSGIAAQDLDEAQRSDTAEAIARVAAAIAKRDAAPDPGDPPPAVVVDDSGPSTPVLGWALVATGAVAVGVGAVSFVMMNDKTSQFDALEDDGNFDGSESEAEALEDDAQMWWTVGVIATGVGVAAAATGLVLIMTHDDGEARQGVHVTGAPMPGGGLVSVQGRF